MQAQVQKWGNSLALRIPRAFAREVELEQYSLVEISVVEGKLVIAPIETPKFDLDDLLDGITAHNLHAEVDSGDALGVEAW